ncbi:hypothetical protein ACOSP6_12840 [Tenacibaculum sp. MEBiC06402]|uniref:hypothetical protein n=1 Tax=unclassified Tenacibaculum TaxID=2635139 RepID=UPI003B9D6D46
MKLQYLIFISLTILFFNCKTDKLEPFVSKNHLESFQTEKPQFFDLDTLEYKTIIGKHGTKIMYYRELFDTIYKDPIQLELIELYDFKEILYRNIPTITTKDELLETSGVLKIKFTSNGKELEIREGKKLLVYPPDGKLKNNDIFLSEKDSLESIKWEITNQNFAYFELYIGGGISKQIIIPSDSLETFTKREKKRREEIARNEKIRYELITKSNSFILKNIKDRWINIDRLVNPEKQISFRIKENINFSGFNIYVIYKNLNSFISYSVSNDLLFFPEVPIIGKVKLIAIGENLEGTFYDEISLNMKKTSKQNLKKLFE